MNGRMNTHRLLPAVIAAALILSHTVEGVRAEKPQGPLTLGFTAGPAPESDNQIEVVFTVVSRRDAARMTASFEIPSDLEVLEGQTAWEGPVAGGKPVVLKVRLGPEARGREIVGRATVYLPGETGTDAVKAWTQAGSIVPETAVSEKPPSRFRTGRKNSTILEIPAP